MLLCNLAIKGEPLARRPHALRTLYSREDNVERSCVIFGFFIYLLLISEEIIEQ